MWGAGKSWKGGSLCLPGITLCLLLCRCFFGLNYAAVHVVLPEETARQTGIEIYASAGPGTTARRLDWTTELPRLRLDVHPGGRVEALYVHAMAGTGSQYEGCEILFGDAWIGPVQRRRLSAKPLTCLEVISGVPKAGSGYEIVRLVPQSVSKSKFISESAVNWQGDSWLLLVPLLQAVFLRLLGGHGLWCLRALPLRKAGFSAWQMPLLVRPFASVLQFIVLLLAGHQMVIVMLRFLSVRSGLQACLAAALLSVLLVLLRRFFEGLRASSAWQLWLRGALLLLLFGCAKVLWSMQIDSYQSTDYGRYARYGELIAAGRWSELVSIREPLSAVYARRAIVTTVPAAIIFGPGTRGIEIINLVTQFATVAIFWGYCCRSFGQAAGTAALPYVLLVPGFWYLGTIASHNVPTHLLLVLLFLCGDYLRVTWRCVERGCGSSGRLLVFSAAYGLLAGLLELGRTYGIFIVAAGGVTAASALFRLLRGQAWKNSPRIFVRPACVLIMSSILAVVVYLQLVDSVDRYLTAKLGATLNAGAMLGGLAAIDSTKDSGGRSLDMWRRVYSVSVPQDDRNQLNLRKLLHEKLVMGAYLYGGVLERNEVYSKQIDGMLQTFDRLKGLVRRLKSSRVPWFSFQQGLCDGIYLLLLLPALLRLLPTAGSVLYSCEFQPLFLTTLIGIAIFLLTESHPYYGLVFALPLCWNAGLISFGEKQGDAGGAMSYLRGVFPEFGRAALWLCLLAGMHLAAGALLDVSNRCFCRMTFRETASGQSGGLLQELSRVHFAIARELGDAGESEVLKAGVEILLPAVSGKELCFLLTANQRILNEDPALDPDRLIVDFGYGRTPYTLTVNGRLWRSGVLSDLKVPEFCVLPLSEFPVTESGKVIVEAALGGKPESELSGGGRPEWLAIEYPYIR